MYEENVGSSSNPKLRSEGLTVKGEKRKLLVSNREENLSEVTEPQAMELSCFE